ncbi:MAG: UDP-N-acetylglucosamine 1-carboxyvinyltransferase [Oscillospiraceae bacterium]|nr:UDP-N-acetylglucosamine 1-carboxyvinyltransferase [Oscillospiraceae bacterium]
MQTLVVRGGKPLCGTICVHGAKNGVLPLLAATLLGNGPSELSDCPEITDVLRAAEILRCLGCAVCREGNTIRVDATKACGICIPPELSGSMRGSVIFLGALLARHGCAELSAPGGCVLGERPIDFHIRALEVLGVHTESEGSVLRFRWPKRRGGVITLPFPSVGATENLMLAAMGVSEPVVICGAAREPEVAELGRFLRAMGAEVEGEGGSVITLRGGKALHGTDRRVLPDRIETATYLSMTAACGGDICLKNTDPELLRPVLDVLEKAGCMIFCEGSEIRLQSDGDLCGVGLVRAETYPGFPTDAQAPVSAALLRAKGCSEIEDTVFPCRFRHIAELRKFGANIQTDNARAVICGVRALHGATATATDLRGGAGVLIAALAAEGESRIMHAELLLRGYAALDTSLQKLGAEVRFA